MARDRLSELLQRSNSVVSTSSSNGSPFNRNSENNTSGNSNNNHNNNTNYYSKKIAEQKNSDSKMSKEQNVDSILNPYADVRVQLAQIASNLETMNRMVQTINIRNFNENEMDNLRNQNLKVGNQLMNRFKEFKAELPPENDYCLEARMKRTLFYGLYQSYINIWNKNEEFLQQYERKLKKNLQLQSTIINGNATEEEIEELIANKTTNLFVGNIIEETEKERKTLRDLMDRFSELKKLEKSIEDVHALFLRIQTLVMEQSETIQRVEFHAQQASLYVDKGGDELEKAEQHHKKSTKKKFILIAILIAVVIVLLFIGIYL